MHVFARLAKLSQILFYNFIKLATVFCVIVILKIEKEQLKISIIQ